VHISNFHVVFFSVTVFQHFFPYYFPISFLFQPAVVSTCGRRKSRRRNVVYWNPNGRSSMISCKSTFSTVLFEFFSFPWFPHLCQIFFLFPLTCGRRKSIFLIFVCQFSFVSNLSVPCVHQTWILNFCSLAAARAASRHLSFCYPSFPLFCIWE